jgi:hypothetical protein
MWLFCIPKTPTPPIRSPFRTPANPPRQNSGKATTTTRNRATKNHRQNSGRFFHFVPQQIDREEFLFWIPKRRTRTIDFSLIF